MNCKPGDLAVVIKGPRSAGRIVKVLRAYRRDEIVHSKCGNLRAIVDLQIGPAWHIEGHVFVMVGGKVYEIQVGYDSCLKPLRDNDGEDETLQWKEL